MNLPTCQMYSDVFNDLQPTVGKLQVLSELEWTMDELKSAVAKLKSNNFFDERGLWPNR